MGKPWPDNSRTWLVGQDGLPDPRLLGMLQMDDSLAKDAPWKLAALPLFLVFWAK